ncbi:efflux RND transporter periplasmic adaptor subunit [Marinigracilibium pacificum]|uniref:Efflux RND transporter periplasmic adaptor subunit n=1 Tax=Marinigracilibium pacificum TaxID=2729599 RepID=A0A848J084_9BACT|nr:efflux RND transporter periplasmic adaptor subunit [Marinigracilibium pacificum]NMM49957.1 efflux RND transporter periplasmic adaptor subunit [Marinigracilibium pacificum]
MKISIKILFLLMIILNLSCNEDHKHADEHGHSHEENESKEENEVHLSLQQFKALNLTIDSIQYRNMSSYVESNGQLEVPPQNEAKVTAIIGANITSIKVIEGDEIKKGQILAYLSHPDLIQLQTEYLNNWNKLEYIKNEYDRQEKLYQENVGSGKEFQKIKAEYQAAKGNLKGLEAQLKLLGLNLDYIRNENIYETVAVRSPIQGSVRYVEVKTGQYVSPQTVMFEIVNIDHIHADLMVFEKDVHKVKKGQKVLFSIESIPNKELSATVYSVGRSFEQDPKAIHLHAEIENKQGLLIPGMYVRGRILTGNNDTPAIPEDGLVRDGNKYFIFTAEKESTNEHEEWHFKPVEVIPGTKDKGWVSIEFVSRIPAETLIVLDNAYYLMAEMNKSEAGHSH